MLLKKITLAITALLVSVAAAAADFTVSTFTDEADLNGKLIDEAEKAGINVDSINVHAYKASMTSGTGMLETEEGKSKGFTFEVK